MCFKYFHGEDGIVTATSPVVQVLNPAAASASSSNNNQNSGSSQSGKPPDSTVLPSAEASSCDSSNSPPPAPLSAVNPVPAENGVDSLSDSETYNAVVKSASTEKISSSGVKGNKDGDTLMWITLTGTKFWHA